MLRWLRRLFARPAPERRRPAPQAPAPAPVVAAEPFDLGTLAEFDLSKRILATAEELRDAGELVASVLELCRREKEDLPPFPAVAGRIFELLERPDAQVDIAELVKLISNDPALSAQVLRLANSALYERGQQVGAVRDAVMRLGFREVSALAAVASTRALFDMEARAAAEAFAPQYQQLWYHAMVSAFGAGWLAMELRRQDTSHAFMAGMLHDVGKVIALRALGTLVVRGRVRHAVPDGLVAAVLEETHVDVGSEAMLDWRLPGYLVTVCLDQHVEEPRRDAALLHIVRVVSGINQLRSNPLHRPRLAGEVETSLSALALTPQQVRALVTQLRAYAKLAESLY